MEFLSEHTNWLILLAVAVGGFTLAKLTGKREGGDLLSNVFSSNREFDSTVGLVGLFAVIFAMIVAFNEEVKQDAAMIFLLAFYALRDMILGKKENGNGHNELKKG